MTDRMPSGARSRRKATIVLFGIVMVGLLVRLIHAWAVMGSTLPFRHQVMTFSDDHAFVQWAKAILAGDWLGRDTYHPYFSWMWGIAPLETWYHWWGGKTVFHQAPLYPYLLAGLLAVTQGSFPVVLLVQLLLGAVQPLLLYYLARRLWNWKVGLLAAVLSALYGPFILHEGFLIRDWLPLLLEPLVLIAVLKASDKNSPAWWVLAGLALGLALLARETASVLIPIVVIWILFVRRADLRRVSWAIGCLAIGLVLALSPLLVRNVEVGAPVLSLSNRAAEGIIEGWAADGYPVGQYIPLSMKEILVRSDGKLPAVIQATMDTYRGDWGEFLRHAGIKLRGITDPFEFPNNISFYYGMELSPILRFTLRYGFLFPLGVAGFLLSLPTLRQHALGTLYLLGATGGLLITIVLARYRLEFASGLILYAAAFLERFLEAARRRRVREVVIGVIVVALLALGQQAILPLGSEVKDYVFPNDYTGSAAVYAERGQFARAVAEIDRALAKVEQHPEYQLLLTGNDGTRARYFHDATLLELQRHFYRAHQLLEAGSLEEARREAEIVGDLLSKKPERDTSRFYALAILFVRLDDSAKAREFLEMVLEQGADDPFAGPAKKLLSKLPGPNRQ